MKGQGQKIIEMSLSGTRWAWKSNNLKVARKAGSRSPASKPPATHSMGQNSPLTKVAGSTVNSRVSNRTRKEGKRPENWLITREETSKSGRNGRQGNRGKALSCCRSKVP